MCYKLLVMLKTEFKASDNLLITTECDGQKITFKSTANNYTQDLISMKVGDYLGIDSKTTEGIFNRMSLEVEKICKSRTEIGFYEFGKLVDKMRECPIAESEHFVLKYNYAFDVKNMIDMWPEKGLGKDSFKADTIVYYNLGRVWNEYSKQFDKLEREATESLEGYIELQNLILELIGLLTRHLDERIQRRVNTPNFANAFMLKILC